jgi:hypothetical protein
MKFWGVTPSESMRGGTLGSNPRQQLPSDWQVSRCSVILFFLVCDEVVEYSIHEPSTLTRNCQALSLGDRVLFHRVDQIGAPIRCSPQLSI